MTDANMADSPAAATAKSKPRLTFPSIRTIIDEPPIPHANSAALIPAIAPYTSDTDPLDQAIHLPSNYADLDEATQTRILLTTIFYNLTSTAASSSSSQNPTPTPSPLAAHLTAQRTLAASLIASHSLGLRYLDALNRIAAAKRDLASYIDKRAPGGKCTRDWGLGECEGLVSALEMAVGRAKGLREEWEGMVVEKYGAGARVRKSNGKGGTPAGLGAAREAREEGVERTVPVGGLGMEMAKEFLVRKGVGGGGTASGVGGIAYMGGVNGAADPSVEAMAALVRDAGLGLSGLTVDGMKGNSEARSWKDVVREIGRVEGEIKEESDDVEMENGVDATAEAARRRRDSKKRKADGPPKMEKRNKWAKAFCDMMD